MASRNGYAHHPPTRAREIPETVITAPANIETAIEQSEHPQFLKSIDDLTALAAAVNAFKRHYDDLQNHMDHIENAIESELKSNGVIIEIASIQSHPSPPRNETAATNAIASQSPPKEEASEDDDNNKSEAERLCESMSSKDLRRYIYANISDHRSKLIEELPAALKLAKDPARFVLESIGKFYLQGRKAFADESSSAIGARKVSLLFLECYLLTFDPSKEKKLLVVVDSSVKEEAEAAAVAWKKRLVGEGGLAVAEAMDARGLLLLVACFGVPENFKNMDLLDLVRQSGTTAEITCALKRSPFIVPIMSGIVDSSIKRGTLMEALEMVYTFGMEERFSPSSILTSFLRMSKESFERAKRKPQAPMSLRNATEKQLDGLLSVMKCLEAHKLDPAKELPGWQIKEQMVKLEKDIIQLDKQMEEARSISLMEEEEAARSKRLYDQQMKRPRLSDMEMPPVASYSPVYRDHRSFSSHRDGGGDADEISALVNSYLGPSSGFPHRSSPGRSAEYMVPHGGGLGRSVSAYDHHLPPNSYSPAIHGQRLPRDYSPPLQQMPYGLQRVYRHSPSVERYLALPNHRPPHNSSQDRIGGM